MKPHYTSKSFRRIRPSLVWCGGFLLGVALMVCPSAFAQKPASPNPARLAQHTLLLDAAAGKGGDVIVGDRGTILEYQSVKFKRKDYVQVTSPSRSMLTGVAVNNTSMWAVGHDKTILRRDEVGGKWELIDFDSGERSDIPVRWTLLDIHWFDDQDGLITGSYGLLMRTGDGGKTWKDSRITWKGFDPELDINEMHLYRLRESPNRTLFCVGDEGAMFRSSDRGKTWDKPDTGQYGAFFDVRAIDDKTIVAVGILGTVIRSTDGGTTWKLVNTSTRSILHALHLSGENLWAYGDGGTRLLSTDKGASFTAKNLSERVAITGRVDNYLLTEKGLRPW